MAITIPALPDPVAWFDHGRHPSARPTTRRQRIGQWTLVITHDPFAGTTWCTLHARSMSYARVAMTFQFPARTPTYEAQYRIDQGPVVSWRANAMTLASVGALTQTDNLTNPSGGRVDVPMALLYGARAIAIRASVREAPRVFKLGDLPAALRVASGAGCGPDFAVPDSP